MGIPPHYIAFNVDLPQNVFARGGLSVDGQRDVDLRRAEGREDPGYAGRHRISVLVVTKEGQEYRGTKDVVVLAKVSDSGRTQPRVGTN